VFRGGPVQREAVLALVRTQEGQKIEGAKRVLEDVYVLSTRAQIERQIRERAAPERFRVYTGYAGWAPDQLATEMDWGSWLKRRSHGRAAVRHAGGDDHPHGHVLSPVQTPVDCPRSSTWNSLLPRVRRLIRRSREQEVSARHVGKRGGVRAVYYFVVRADLVYMLDVYAKNEKSDLTPADKREIKAIVSMLESL
jgi:hypothetical protein